MIAWLISKNITVEWLREPPYQYPHVVVRWHGKVIADHVWNDLGHIWMATEQPRPRIVVFLEGLWKRKEHSIQ